LLIYVLLMTMVVVPASDSKTIAASRRSIEENQRKQERESEEAKRANAAPLQASLPNIRSSVVSRPLSVVGSDSRQSAVAVGSFKSLQSAEAVGSFNSLQSAVAVGSSSMNSLSSMNDDGLSSIGFVLTRTLAPTLSQAFNISATTTAAFRIPRSALEELRTQN
jgi:hypothetical protein